MILNADGEDLAEFLEAWLPKAHSRLGHAPSEVRAHPDDLAAMAGPQRQKLQEKFGVTFVGKTNVPRRHFQIG